MAGDYQHVFFSSADAVVLIAKDIHIFSNGITLSFLATNVKEVNVWKSILKFSNIKQIYGWERWYFRLFPITTCTLMNIKAVLMIISSPLSLQSKSFSLLFRMLDTESYHSKIEITVMFECISKKKGGKNGCPYMWTQRTKRSKQLWELLEVH